MQISFYKYQGTGNDFVLIDNRQQKFPKNNTTLVAQICDRKFGVGADGLILLEQHPSEDFSMIYFNADGNQSTMCGNGGRCIVHFAAFLGIIKTKTHFMAIDGVHHASLQGDEVALRMSDVSDIEIHQQHCFLNTGSPHHVEMVANIEDINVLEKGRALRYNHYGTLGANINFVSKIANQTFEVRTYERGVEAETLSCGTGVTAVALAMFETKQTNLKKVNLKTLGGDLSVCFDKKGQTFTNIILSGPAKQVFKGVCEI